MNNLNKVHIQDTNPEKIMPTMKNAFGVLQRESYISPYEALSQKSKAIKEYQVAFHLEDNVDQFLIPYELNQ